MAQPRREQRHTGRLHVDPEDSASVLLHPLPSQIAEPSFVAVDFETANRMGGVSACQVAMVKVCDGQ